MSLQVIEGFEDGIVENSIPGKWDQVGHNGVGTTYGRHGKGMAWLDSGWPTFGKNIEPHSTAIWGSAVNIRSWSNSNDSYSYAAWRFIDGSTTHISLQLKETEFVIYRGTSLVGRIPHSLAEGVWRFIEIKVVVADAGSVTIRVDANEIGTWSGDTRDGSSTVVSNVGLRRISASADYQFWVDDVYIVNGAGTTHNDFLGDHRVDLALPSGNGNYSQLVGSDGDSVDNFLLVDENPPATADYVGSATDGAKDTYLFADASTGRTIAGVQTVQYSAKTDTGAKSIRQLARIGGVDYPGDAKLLGTSYAAFMRVMENSPATGTDWTEAEFNGAEFGVEVQP